MKKQLIRSFLILLVLLVAIWGFAIFKYYTYFDAFVISVSMLVGGFVADWLFKAQKEKT